MPEKSKLFLVFCLHRSGSSATAGVMHLLGIHMGDNLLPASPHNKKGHFENTEFVSLNQEILRSVNSSWDKPPIREKIIKANFPERKIRKFLSEHIKPVWGLKDPRTLLTFEIWKPYLEEIADVNYVFVHRPFEASVRSLSYRDRKGNEISKQILTPYLTNLYHYRHNYGLKNDNLIDVYYQDLLQNPEPFINKLNEKIGNTPNHQMEQVKKFLDRKLKKF